MIEMSDKSKDSKLMSMYLYFYDSLQANKSKESQLNDGSECGTSDDGSNKKPTKKKRVSFKFGFETSDDAHIAKKEPNTIFDPPVSIIKKECLTRAIKAAPIIMPSRLKVLTPLRLRHNNANNIDKLNSLTFKSQTPKKDTNSDENLSSNEDDQSDGDVECDGRRKGSDDNRDSDEESNHSQIGDDDKNDDNDDADDDRSKGVAFQLSKRNSHSSRGIKSNKRFIDDKNGMGKKKDTKLENDGDSFEANNKKEGRETFLSNYIL